MITHPYNKVVKPSLLSLFIILSTLSLSSQSSKTNKVYNNYINKYKDLAIDHMQTYKIPASITLAQGLLESGAGESTLAIKSNNHFGIKCSTQWTGKQVYHNDDKKNDCFRKYNSAEGSFQDHALFLTERDRYKSLFSLKATDYKGWAKGLQKAGYATDKSYANKLIQIIEDYELYNYDKAGSKSKPKSKNNTQEYIVEKEVEVEKIETSKPQYNNNRPSNKPSNLATTTNQKILTINSHTIYKTHNLVYVIIQTGDTYENIAKEFNFNVNDLFDFNETDRNIPLRAGDLVYLEKKKTRADKPYYEHIVQVGESMHTISQKYGIKTRSLYQINKKDYSYVPTQGDILRLR